MRSCSAAATAARASSDSVFLPPSRAAFQRHRVLDAALDAAHPRESAQMRDVGCLAGPRRHGAKARHDEEGLDRATLLAFFERIAVVHQRLDLRAVFSGQFSLGIDEVQILPAHAGDIRVDARERVEQAGLTEIGEGRSAGETREVGHGT
ncbi:hypothetical protein OKW44_004202 [Paraburkholderia sp. WSM4174]